MAFFNWTSDFNTGVNNMDREHQNLVSIMNRLFELNRAGKPSSEILNCAEELARATIEHFQHEEVYMESISHPKLVVHKRIHQDLLGKFEGHLQSYRAKGDVLSDEFFKFLSFWLSAHIRGVDKQYGPDGVDILAA